jgi:hypothetical protein
MTRHLPAPTSDVEQGWRDLEQYGYAIHEAVMAPEDVARLRSRLEEQAELECEQGVASFRMASADVIGDRHLGRPPQGKVPAWQAILALPNQGREFIDLMMNPIVPEYGCRLFGGIPYYMAQSTGILVRRGSGGQVLHSDQLPVPYFRAHRKIVAATPTRAIPIFRSCAGAATVARCRSKGWDRQSLEARG